jgi:hypothetical protein
MAKKMGSDDAKYRGFLASRVAECNQGLSGGSTSSGSNLAEERKTLLKGYRGEAFDTVPVGRSSYVSRDVAETIEAAMPAMLRTFSGEIVKAQPIAPETDDHEAFEKSTEMADRATQYAQYVWERLNEGFLNAYTVIKDGLMQRIGITKTTVEKKTDVRTEYYQDVDEVAMSGLKAAGLEVVQVVQNESGTYDVEAKRKSQTKQIKISPVPPEELLISPRARGGPGVDFIGQVQLLTQSDLLETGISKSVVDKLSTVDYDSDPNGEALNRNPSGSLVSSADEDDSQRRFEIVEAWTRYDADGDGIAELRHVIFSGRDCKVILSDEPDDDHGFSWWSPIIETHRSTGWSIADFVIDIQRINSYIWRGALDNMALANNPRRQVLVGQVNLQDLASTAIGQIQRVRQMNSIEPETVPPVIPAAQSMIEAMSGVREQRSGIQRFTSTLQGTEQNAYSETLGGAQMVKEAANDRLELYARICGEMFFKRQFSLIISLSAKHIEGAVAVPVADKFVRATPKEFDPAMRFDVCVGLGAGAISDRRNRATVASAMVEKMVTAQGGLEGQFVGPEQVYNAAKLVLDAEGIRNTEAFLKSPEDEEEKPDPTVPEEPTVDPTKKYEIDAKIQVEKYKIDTDATLRREQMQLEEKLSHDRFALELAQGDKLDTVQLGGAIG